jgi:hypothetical protein
MSNGVNWRDLALDLRNQLVECEGVKDGLLEALKEIVNEAEQSVFEKWLIRTSTSGCCESVDAQWRMSSDYLDFLDEWAKQVAALARATGEQP